MNERVRRIFGSHPVSTSDTSDEGSAVLRKAPGKERKRTLPVYPIGRAASGSLNWTGVVGRRRDCSRALLFSNTQVWVFGDHRSRAGAPVPTVKTATRHAAYTSGDKPPRGSVREDGCESVSLAAASSERDGPEHQSQRGPHRYPRAHVARSRAHCRATAMPMTVDIAMFMVIPPCGAQIARYRSEDRVVSGLTPLDA